jgi:Na+-translocating ferredoxin:NAD+ oxidoreductase RnfE subunit
MKGSTLASAVGLTFLFVHGVLVLCPLTESASHKGNALAFAAECAWVLWENRDTISRLRAAIHSGTSE